MLSKTFQWGTMDAEFKDPSVENLELTNVLRLKPGVGCNIGMQASSLPGIPSLS